MKTTQLQENIMRRVYYAFMLRMALHPVVVNSLLFIGALFVFARMVHVARIIESLQTLPVANLPVYVMSALSHGEVLTLLSMAVMAVAIGRVAFSLPTVVLPPHRYAVR